LVFKIADDGKVFPVWRGLFQEGKTCLVEGNIS
jgi:hypothetical protein